MSVVFIDYTVTQLRRRPIQRKLLGEKKKKRKGKRKNRGRKELTKRRRYDKLNTPSRWERQHQNRQQKRKQKEPIKKIKKDVDKPKKRW